MIDWVDAYCKAWGKQRAALAAHTIKPLPSVFGKMMDGWSIAAASSGKPSQPVHGALTGNALIIHVAVQRAIEARRFPERLYLTLCAHYLVDGKVEWKARKLGISVVGYYRLLHRLHVRLARFIDTPAPTNL